MVDRLCVKLAAVSALQPQAAGKKEKSADARSFESDLLVNLPGDAATDYRSCQPDLKETADA
jgi:hypothetical protein